MSTEPAKKKHKADDCDDAHEDEGAASMAEVGGTTMGAILAEMKSHMSHHEMRSHMQNEMDGMRGDDYLVWMSSRGNVKYKRRIWISWKATANFSRPSVDL